AQGIAVGDLDQTVDSTARDELGETAAAFRSMIAYLHELAQAVGRIAAGDLTMHVEPKSDHDVLGVAVAGMVESLRGIVAEVSGAATGMSSASEQLASTSHETSRAVEEIARAVQDVASGAERQVKMVQATSDLADE